MEDLEKDHYQSATVHGSHQFTQLLNQTIKQSVPLLADAAEVICT